MFLGMPYQYLLNDDGIQNKALDYNEAGNVDYCNESKCQLRDDCRYYLISTTGITTSPEKEALWGEIFEMCGYTDTHDQYFNTIIVDYTYKQLLEQHYNISILMKDKAFVEMCDELAECYSESRAYMYINNMRWNDWDELRYQCENEGIAFYAIEEKYRANGWSCSYKYACKSSRRSRSK